jgi:hypothetical protein
MEEVLLWMAMWKPFMGEPPTDLRNLAIVSSGMHELGLKNINEKP